MHLPQSSQYTAARSYLNANGASDPNSAVGDQGAAILIADINDTRSMLSSLNLGKTIPVGNSDAGSYFNTKVLEASDYGVSAWHVASLYMLIVQSSNCRWPTYTLGLRTSQYRQPPHGLLSSSKRLMFSLLLYSATRWVARRSLYYLKRLTFLYSLKCTLLRQAGLRYIPFYFH